MATGDNHENYDIGVSHNTEDSQVVMPSSIIAGCNSASECISSIETDVTTIVRAEEVIADNEARLPLFKDQVRDFEFLQDGSIIWTQRAPDDDNYHSNYFHQLDSETNRERSAISVQGYDHSNNHTDEGLPGDNEIGPSFLTSNVESPPIDANLNYTITPFEDNPAANAIPLDAQVVDDQHSNDRIFSEDYENHLQGNFVENEELPLAIVTSVQKRNGRMDSSIAVVSVAVVLSFFVVVVVVITMSLLLLNKSSNTLPISNSSAVPTVSRKTPDISDIPTLSPSSYSYFYELGIPISGDYEESGAGNEVAISRNGLLVAVGAPRSSVFGTDDGYGHVYVYKYSFTFQTWSKVCVLRSLYQYDGTGQSISLDGSGEIVAVGSPGFEPPDDTPDGNRTKGPGIVRVHRIFFNDTIVYGLYDTNNIRTNKNSSTLPFVDGTSEQIGSSITFSDDGDEFGWSIDLSDDGMIIAVASRRNCYVQTYRYSREERDWMLYGQLINCTSSSLNGAMRTTITVRLSGDGSVLVIGEYPDVVEFESKIHESIGYVHVHHFNGSSWRQRGSTMMSEHDGDKFGTSVAISFNGNVVAAAAPNATGSSTITGVQDHLGSCRIFRYDVDLDDWVQLGSTLFGPDFFERKQQYGSSISLNAQGTAIAIGAPSFTEEYGYVVVETFSKDSNSWSEGFPHVLTSQTKWSSYGTSVALSADGRTIAIGDPSLNVLNRPGTASVRELYTPNLVDSSFISVAIATNWFNSSDTHFATIDRLDVDSDEYLDVFTFDTLQDGVFFPFPVNGVFRLVDRYVDDVTISYFYDSTDDSNPFVEQGKSNYSQYTFTTQENKNGIETTGTGLSFITLQIDFDRRPYEVHWVLVHRLEGSRTILAYGPKHVYGMEWSESQYSTTIDTSLVGQGSNLTLIYTDDGRDGLCCYYGFGSIRIYNGTLGGYNETASDSQKANGTNSTDGTLLFSSTAEGQKRLVHNFSLF